MSGNPERREEKIEVGGSFCLHLLLVLWYDWTELLVELRLELSTE
jgi:hypothetical protein